MKEAPCWHAYLCMVHHSHCTNASIEGVRGFPSTQQWMYWCNGAVSTHVILLCPCIWASSYLHCCLCTSHRVTQTTMQVGSPTILCNCVMWSKHITQLQLPPPMYIGGLAPVDTQHPQQTPKNPQPYPTHTHSLLLGPWGLGWGGVVMPPMWSMCQHWPHWPHWPHYHKIGNCQSCGNVTTVVK